MEFTINTVGSTIFQSITISKEENPDWFAIKMLTNNEISGLLPMTVIRKNLDAEIRYNVTSLVPLSQLIQEPLSKTKVLNVLRSVVLAATQVEEYMLDVTELSLKEEQIYVNMISGEAKLMYLPFHTKNSEDVIGFVKRLITSLQYEPGEDFSYILKLMNALNGGSITTVAELEQFIGSLERKERTIEQSRKEEKSPVREVPKKVEVAKTANTNPQPNLENATAIPVPVPVIPSASQPDKGNKLSLFGSKSKDGEKKEEKKSDKSKNRLFGLKGNYDSKSKQRAKVPGFAIPGMNDISGLPLTPQEEVHVQSKDPSPKNVSEKNRNIGNIVANAVENAPNVSSRTSDFGNVFPNVNMDYGNTIMMNQNNSAVTIMLDENGLDSEEPRRASITRIANNQKMYMDKDILKIGKESDYVDFYIGNNPTISRTHADIVLKDGGYYIRDNNSKNHTYLNDRMIVPGKLEQLKNNDRIKISNEELVFQLF